MDLGAYVNIDYLSEIAKTNGIEVPRLRGYRLMSEEEPVDIKEIYQDIEYDCCKELCEASPFWSIDADYYEISDYTDFIKDFYCPDKKVRWDRIHGWKRKVLKTYIHNEKKRIIKQYELFNYYCGRKDILYIHSRIGGGNWKSYYQEVVNQPWFIEKVDDSFDSTYCDIYAKIDPKTIEQINENKVEKE